MMLKLSAPSKEHSLSAEALAMEERSHWTTGNIKAFTHSISLAFIMQIEKRMEEIPLTQAALAEKLHVSEGAVSKVLNNPENLTIKTMATYALALGMKVAIVAYDDQDPFNRYGPIDSEVFSTCWERSGKPRDFWSLPEPTVVSNSRALTILTFLGWQLPPSNNWTPRFNTSWAGYGNQEIIQPYSP
jgi:transcriptional regulator with XRE-family HTH domain